MGGGSSTSSQLWTHYAIVLKYSQYNPEWILCIILIKSFLSKYSYPFEMKEYQHKVVISTISSSNLTHHYAGNNVSQHHQQHVVPGNRVHFRSVIHSIVISQLLRKIRMMLVVFGLFSIFFSIVPTTYLF